MTLTRFIPWIRLGYVDDRRVELLPLVPSVADHAGREEQAHACDEGRPHRGGDGGRGRQLEVGKMFVRFTELKSSFLSPEGQADIVKSLVFFFEFTPPNLLQCKMSNFHKRSEVNLFGFCCSTSVLVGGAEFRPTFLSHQVNSKSEKKIEISSTWNQNTYKESIQLNTDKILHKMFKKVLCFAGLTGKYTDKSKILSVLENCPVR